MANGSRVLTRPQQAATVRYDWVTITLHWATAILVVLLYGIAQSWGFTPRHSWLRAELMSTHVSLGVLLASVLTVRVLWRVFAGRHLRPMIAGTLGRVAEGVHYLMYALLLAVVPLGICLRWSGGHTIDLFGYVPIPSPFHLTKADENLLFQMHWWVATSIIVVAGLHAAAALVHHYVLRDPVLGRMLPDRSAGAVAAE